MRKIKTYSELITLPTLEERIEYCMIFAGVGIETFGNKRWLNQMFYQLPEWKKSRDDAIIRDNGCDLGVEGYDIHGGIYVHHLNPITIEDIETKNPDIFDLRFLICCSFDTHQLIHYGKEKKRLPVIADRRRNDTIPWKQ